MDLYGDMYYYLRIAIMDSEKAGKWSIEEASIAVKAVLTGMGLEAKMRFKGLRSEISKSRTITDRTLDKALKRLLARGEIVREEVDGRVLYSLSDAPTINESYAPTTNDREIFFKLDTMTIEGAVKIGALVNPEETWSIYGISKKLNLATKRRLRREALDFQVRVDAALADDWDKTVQRLLERYRKDFTKKERAQFKTAFDFLFELYSTRGDCGKARLYEYLIVEKIAPEFLAEEISRFAKTNVWDRYKKMAIESGFSPEEFDKERLKAERCYSELESFLKVLKPKEREEVSERLAPIIQARISWCAVVR